MLYSHEEKERPKDGTAFPNTFFPIENESSANYDPSITWVLVGLESYSHDRRVSRERNLLPLVAARVLQLRDDEVV